MKPSTIPGAGYGLFANRNYKKGEHIIEYTGEVIDEATKRQDIPTMNARMSCMSCTTCT